MIQETYYKLGPNKVPETLSFDSLGNAWLNLLYLVSENGVPFSDELKEIKNIPFYINYIDKDDEILLKYANQEHINQMHHVFNDTEHNIFGHSYVNSICGPQGLNDLSDVIDKFKNNIYVKSATIVFKPMVDKQKVPCIQSVHFINRDGVLETTYFARAQDVYKKFYADVLVLNEFSKKISKELNLDLGPLCGFISSLQIYREDYSTVNSFIQNIMMDNDTGVKK